MTTRPFLKLDKDLMSAVSLYDTYTKKTIHLEMTGKFLYSFFLDRYNFWNSQQALFFDSIESMASKTPCSVSTIIRFIKEFRSIGVIQKTKKDRSNVYVVKDIFVEDRWKLLQRGEEPVAQHHCHPIKSGPVDMPLDTDDYEYDSDIPF